MKKYILGIILTAFLALSGVFSANTMALDSDYKNNLLKVDLTKINDSTYKIDLFTQKPYNEPIKVIKKSDTSYYVLLPETYHSITSVGSSGDINRVDVKLYPYAGQDLNNGYTKINILTSKPIEFTASVKTAGGQKPNVDTKKLAQLDKAFDNKAKNPVAVKVQPAKVQPVPVQTATKPIQPTVKPAQTAVKQAEKAPVKIATSGVGVIAQNPQKIETQSKPAQSQIKPVQKQPVSVKPASPEGTAGSTTEIEIVAKPKIQQQPKQQEISEPKDSIPQSLEEVLDAEETDEDMMMDEDAREQGLTELATGEDEVIPELTQKERIKNYAKAFMKMVINNIFAVIAIILLAIAIVLMSRGLRGRKQAADGENLADGAFGAMAPWKDENTVPRDISDKPAEAVEYTAYEGGSIETPAAVSVGEAASVGIGEIGANENYEPKPMQTYEEAKSVATVESEEDTADVLAQEAFGENRGLCLVNYEGSIALIGYIGEEIFVIQNFGKITLINPNIQIRIAEQNDNDTIYIVKTANSKLMVRETKDLIGLEMVM